jgi:hypothetical protein
MEQVETYNENIDLILKHGNNLLPEERIKYYEAVIHELYVVRGAFDRDKYLGENTIKKILENEIVKAKTKIETDDKSSDIIKINATVSISDLVRIFEPMMEVGIISKKTETKRVLRQFYKSTELDESELNYNKRSHDILSNQRTTKSDLLIDYVEKFIEMNFNGRKDVLMRLEKKVCDLQK